MQKIIMARLLADGRLPDQVMNYLKNKKLTRATIFGGEAVFSPSGAGIPAGYDHLIILVQRLTMRDIKDAIHYLKV